jgi:hypothetical protein
MLKLTKKEAELYTALIGVFQTSVNNLISAFTDLEVELYNADRVDIEIAYEADEDVPVDREDLSWFAYKIAGLNPEEFLGDRLFDLKALKSECGLDLSAAENEVREPLC